MRVFVRTKAPDYVQEVMLLHERTEPVITREEQGIIITDLPEDTIQGMRDSELFLLSKIP